MDMHQTEHQNRVLVLLAAHANLQLAVVAAALLEDEESKKKEERKLAAMRRKRRRRYWVRPWLLRRPQMGQYERLLTELMQEDTSSYTNFLRMEPAMFQGILGKIGHRITKEDTFWRKSLEPGLRLAITLRYLATGNSYRSLMYGFRVAYNTISNIIREVCEAIIAEYNEDVLACPTTPEEWREVAKLFYSRWNFPHCIGAIDGKHVAIKCPPKGGSVYFNYKGFHSIVLMALVDADYKFLYVDCGANGAGSDGGVFNDTLLREGLEEGTIGLPPPEPILPGHRPLPYFIVGDDAFPLRTWLMKPLPLRNMTKEQRIYNYRLSRARRIVENAFGILAARFRCLLTTMPQRTKTVESIVIACCCLHNLMRITYPTAQNIMLDHEDPITHRIIPGTWRAAGEIAEMPPTNRGHSMTEAAKNQRQYLVDFVNSDEGRVPWQDDMV